MLNVRNETLIFFGTLLTRTAYVTLIVETACQVLLIGYRCPSSRFIFPLFLVMVLFPSASLNIPLAPESIQDAERNSSSSYTPLGSITRFLFCFVLLWQPFLQVERNSSSFYKPLGSITLHHTIFVLFCFTVPATFACWLLASATGPPCVQRVEDQI